MRNTRRCKTSASRCSIFWKNSPPSSYRLECSSPCFRPCACDNSKSAASAKITKHFQLTVYSSISSSPLWNPNHVTLTFAVLEAPSKSGHGTHVGVASSYLDSLEVGDKLHVAVRKSHAAFHLPQDPENTPVICIGAGTGISPFRGFIQERAEMIAAGRKLAPAMLLIGCRAPGRDDLYAEELAAWEKAGAVTVKRAYSRATDKSNGIKYVQDLLPAYEDEVIPLWEANARLYTCGSRAIGDGIKNAVIKMVLGRQKAQGEEISEERVAKWWEGLRNVRYATDVFD